MLFDPETQGITRRKMMKDYLFRSAIPGDVSKICNEASKDGYSVEELYKEGPKFWILMSRDVAAAVPVVKKSAPKKKPVKKAAAPKVSIEEESATKE
jgi:hypothetical protein